jgi:hypothetical protein
VVTGGIAAGVTLGLNASLEPTHLAGPPAHGQQTVWLHVHVDKRTTSQHQTSTARAWTTSDRAGQHRVPVARLHLVLTAFGRKEDHCDKCDGLQVEEVHTGPGTATAVATAWCEGPTIGPITKSV